MSMSKYIIRAIALAIAAMEPRPGKFDVETRANYYVKYIKTGGMS